MNRQRTVNTDSEIIVEGYIKNISYFNKPPGLWYGFDFSWIDFQATLTDWALKTHLIEIKIDPTLIYTLTVDSLKDIINNYSKAGQVNWLKFVQDYDGIEIPDYKSINQTFLGKHYFDGWGCDSGVIWNLSIIKSQELIW